MCIRVFKLPSFEEWQSKGYTYHEKIGVFHCTVERFSYGRDAMYFQLAVADCEVPSNIYVDQIIRLCYEHKPSEADAREKLKSWYDSLQTILNERWSKYIKETYTTLGV